MTTRRLSTEIEYSQPVLYKHFASMEDIVEAVALEGFGELAEVPRRRCGAAQQARGCGRTRLPARTAPSPLGTRPLYDAMFTRATRLALRLPRTPRPRCQPRTPNCARPSPRSPASGTSTPSPRCCGPRCTDWPRSAAATGYARATTPSASISSSPSSAPPSHDQEGIPYGVSYRNPLLITGGGGVGVGAGATQREGLERLQLAVRARHVVVGDRDRGVAANCDCRGRR